MSKFRSYLRDQQFNPGFAGIFINPFYIVRTELRLGMKSLSSNIRDKTLDVGCGHKPYRDLFNNVSEYIGLEYDTPRNRMNTFVDVFFDGHHFPFPNGGFDSLILTQVLEHIFHPDEFLSEITRVLKKGGHMLMSVPFVWDEHDQPHDYARYSSFGLDHLLQKHGLEVVKHLKTCPDIRVIFQLTACYLHKKLARVKNYRLRVIFYIILISPVTIAGILLSKILPKNHDLYMDNIVLAKKI